MYPKRRLTFWEQSDGKFIIGAFSEAAKRPDKLHHFMGQLFTTRECQKIAKRLHVCRYLLSRIPYSGIRAFTGMSSESIAKLADRTRHQNDGVREVLFRLRMYDRTKQKFDPATGRTIRYLD